MMTPSPANLAYFLECSAENYFGIQNEPSGYWLGSGCQKFNLFGLAPEKAIANLAAGYSPDGEQALVQIQGYQDRERQPGWDLTFNAPKSVSIRWGISKQTTREEISRFQAESVGEAFQFLEENGAFSRRKQDGQVYFDRAKLIAVGFEHASSRNLDPHLHTHVVVLNVGIRPDGSTGTVVSKPFWTLQKAAGAVYRASLSHKIREAELDGLRKAKNSFELKSVAVKAIDFWSSRRKEIIKRAQEKGVKSLKGFDLITYQTRREKVSIDRNDLFDNWSQIAVERNFRFSPTILPELPQKQIKTLSFEAVANSISKLEANQSHFSYDQVLSDACCRIEHQGIAVKHILNAIQSAVANGQLVHLGTHQEKSHFSTPYLLEKEKQLHELAQVLSERIDVFLELSSDQNDVVDKVIQNNFERAEKTLVLNLTPAGASESNKKFGVESITYSRFMKNQEIYRDANLLVLNSSAFNTQQLLSICDHTKDSGCRLHFFDRQKQVRFFGAKGGFELIRGVVPHQPGSDDHVASTPKLENVRQFEMLEKAITKMVAEWNLSTNTILDKQISVDDPQVAGLINAICQMELNKGRATSMPLALGSGEAVFLGDLIRFTVDLKEHELQAGQCYELHSISLADNSVVIRTREKLHSVPLRCLRFAELGFAATEFQLRETNEPPTYVLINSEDHACRQIETSDQSKIFAYRSSFNLKPNQNHSGKVDILDLLTREQSRDFQSATRLKQQLQQGL